LNAIKHGFYSKHIQKNELKDLEKIGDIQEEIQMVRVVIRRLLEAASKCKEVEELSNLLNTLGLVSTRVAGLMKTRKFLCQGKNGMEETINQAFDDVLKEWGRIHM
jgi:hypothetical protein